MSDRRLELERKKQKLAMIREEKEKRRREKMKEKAEADAANKTQADRVDFYAETDELLESLGIPTPGYVAVSPEIKRSAVSITPEIRASPVKEIEPCNVTKKSDRLSIVTVHQTNIPPKEYVSYNKQTQTNSTGVDREGSLSCSPYKDYGHYWRSRKARPLDYYEWDDEFQVLTYGDVSVEEDVEGSSLTSHDMDTPPLYPPGHHSHKLTGLPHVEMVRPAQDSSVPATPMSEKDKEHNKKIRELSEEEKKQITMREDFQLFFRRTTKIVERALSENVDLVADYSGAIEEQDLDDLTGIKLSLNRTFFDDRWSKNRTITSFDWSSQFPELLVASYNHNEESPNDPDGVCLIWNMKFKKKTPEYIFHCQSSVMSACFAKFHPNLVLGGTYSGQIVLWDNRSNKRTPVQRSPLSAVAHTHPVYCIQVVGTQNAHNLVSVSTDGKFCSWSLDMLSAPQDTMELSHQKQSKAVSVTSMSFPYGEFNNFVVGSEEGSIYTACRHGSKAGILDTFEGHQGPVTAIDTHCIPGSIDFSHLFLTSSLDWTVKLWSLKDNKELYSFENNADYVYDVAWSPLHPALFSSVDGTGRLDVWNLNNDTELPTVSLTVDGKPSLNRVTWTPLGHQIAVGDDIGKIHVYDVGEQLAVPKNDEWPQFVHTLAELENNKADQDLTIASSLSSGNLYVSPIR